jgi:hypothetical protein
MSEGAGVVGAGEGGAGAGAGAGADGGGWVKLGGWMVGEGEGGSIRTRGAYVPSQMPTHPFFPAFRCRLIHARGCHWVVCVLCTGGYWQLTARLRVHVIMGHWPSQPLSRCRQPLSGQRVWASGGHATHSGGRCLWQALRRWRRLRWLWTGLPCWPTPCTVPQSW